MNKLNVEKISARQDELPIKYAEMVIKNPLLARIEDKGKGAGWSDEEIRTLQLLVACNSNASLMQRLMELERSLKK